MSDNASWYQRKMQQMRGQQQPSPQQQQQQPYRQGYSQPPQQNLPQYPQSTPQYPPPQQQQPMGLPPKVTMENLYEAAGYWRGGQAHKVDRDPCPNCGSNQYFSRAVSKRGPPPAPHCYNCGYNDGMFMQGEASTWGVSA